MILLLIISFLGIAFLDMPKLIKNKDKKEIIVFSIFFIFAFVMSLLHILGVKIPSPMQGIQNIIKKLGINY